MEQLTKLEKLLEFYTDELSMWELSKKKALELNQSAIVYEFNIDRYEQKVNHIKELIASESEKEKSLHQDLYRM